MRSTKREIDVVAAVIVKDKKIFAARRRPGTHLAGYWEFPGGKREPNETAEQCLFRELQEELCITTKIGRFIGVSIFDYGVKIVKLTAYLVEHIEGSIRLNEHDEYQWLPIEELGHLKWAPADIPIVEQFIRCNRD